MSYTDTEQVFSPGMKRLPFRNIRELHDPFLFGNRDHNKKDLEAPDLLIDDPKNRK